MGNNKFFIVDINRVVRENRNAGLQTVKQNIRTNKAAQWDLVKFR
jgi:hypothetical protein